MTHFITKLLRSVAAALVMSAGFAGAASAQANDEVKSTHGAWEVRCAPNGACVMTQTFNDGEGRPVLRMTIRKLDEARATDAGTIVARGQILTPLNVLLRNGVGMRIDGGDVKSAPYWMCTQVGCVARPPLQDTLIDEFQKGSNIEFLTEVETTEGPKFIKTEISLTGFTDAYNAL